MTLVFCMLAINVSAETTPLSLELNNMQSTDSGCRISFVAVNSMPSELQETSFEIVIFNAQSIVEDMLVLEFGRLPAGKTKVVQFDLAEKSCDGISRLLINDVAACTGADLSPQVCLDALSTSTKSQVIFGK